MEHTVLVVEDEKGIRDAIAIYLKNQGYQVCLASNGKEGLEMIAENEIHLAIVDIMMPVMGGYEATRQIRRLDRTDAQSIPIIALTANAFAEDIQHAMDAGMNAHVAKPLNIKTIKKIIINQLK